MKEDKSFEFTIEAGRAERHYWISSRKGYVAPVFQWDNIYNETR